MKVTLALIVSLFIIGTAWAEEGAAKTAAPKGKQIFLDKKCNQCHSIESEGVMKKTPSTSKTGPPDLSNVGSDLKASDIEKFLKKETDLHGKKHMMKFAGTDEDLKTLASYLEGLKSKKDAKETKEKK
ncbi:MAG TPA: cytochrome c [Bacteroidota bacterium]|nr:cytochrome c [Bacteroidota bacterium]